MAGRRYNVIIHLQHELFVEQSGAALVTRGFTNLCILSYGSSCFAMVTGIVLRCHVEPD